MVGRQVPACILSFVGYVQDDLLSQEVSKLQIFFHVDTTCKLKNCKGQGRLFS